MHFDLYYRHFFGDSKNKILNSKIFPSTKIFAAICRLIAAICVQFSLT